MANLTLRRRRSKQQRALSAVSKARSAAMTFVKARIAWLAGKNVAKVAVPAAAVGTVAMVAKKRSSQGQEEHPSSPNGLDAVPSAPAGAA
jgi:uncharacterized protein involved in cysteine biosynthesis